MYKVRSENLDELREGKTILYLSKLIEYPRTYLNSIFTGKILIEEEKVIEILKPILKESYKLNEKYKKYGMDIMIKHFFKKIE